MRGIDSLVLTNAIGLYDAFESMLTCKICAGIENTRIFPVIYVFVVIYELFIELQEGNGRKGSF